MGSCVKGQGENAFSMVGEIESYIEHAEQVLEGVDGAEYLELKLILSEMRRSCVAFTDLVRSRIAKRQLSDRDMMELVSAWFEVEHLHLMRMEDYETMQAQLIRQAEEIAALDNRVKQLLEN